MKSKVVVTLKEGVLDPQGQTIARSLKKMGHDSVTSVRQGKYFELEFAGIDAEQARQATEEIASRVLSNPIIEVYEIEDVP